MPIEIKLPALSPTMEKGTLAKWRVKVGDIVKCGDAIADIETDKATIEIEATEGGRVAQLIVAAGSDDVPVGTIIATLTAAPSTHDAAPTPPATAPAPPRAPRPSLVTAAASPASAVTPAPVAAVASMTAASPLAERLAFAQGRSLDGIVGSGPAGLIVKADLMPARAIPQPHAIPQAALSPIPTDALAPHVAVKTSGMRKTIARRLTFAAQNIPQFHLTVRCRLDALSQQRTVLNAGISTPGKRLLLNDLLIKALALALDRVPDAHVQYAGDTMLHFSRADIAMAVAVDGGLLTPVIRDAGRLSLSAIAALSRTLAAAARTGTLTPQDCDGGTASISNLGMYGVDEMFPVINPPQALILGIGAGVEQPWKTDGGGIGLTTVAALTAGFDHRAIDGATAARFMSALRDLVENPLQILA